MHATKLLIGLALSCGLTAVPVFAQVSIQHYPGSTMTNSYPEKAPSGSTQYQTNGTMGAQSAATEQPSRVQADVHSAIQQNETLANDNIHVKVNKKHQILLTGTVASRIQRMKAFQVAAKTAPRIYSVKNELKVSPKSYRGWTSPQQ